MVVMTAAVIVAVIVSMAVACGWFPVAVIVIVPTIVSCGWFALAGLIVTMLVTVIVLVAVVVIVTTVAGVVVVLAHASLPLEGSAICSSISLRTSLIWASAAE